MVYSLFGSKALPLAGVLFLSYRWSDRALKEAKRAARRAKIKSFAYAPADQEGFRKLLEAMRPRLIVPLDASAFSALGEPELIWHGLYYYRIKRGYSMALPPLPEARLEAKLTELSSVRKFAITRRAKLLRSLMRAELSF